MYTQNILYFKEEFLLKSITAAIYLEHQQLFRSSLDAYIVIIYVGCIAQRHQIELFHGRFTAFALSFPAGTRKKRRRRRRKNGQAVVK